MSFAFKNRAKLRCISISESFVMQDNSETALHELRLEQSFLNLTEGIIQVVFLSD